MTKLDWRALADQLKCEAKDAGEWPPRDPLWDILSLAELQLVNRDRLVEIGEAFNRRPCPKCNAQKGYCTACCGLRILTERQYQWVCDYFELCPHCHESSSGGKSCHTCQLDDLADRSLDE